MITALTPDQVAWAMEKIYREGVSKDNAASILGVNRHTLRHALKDATKLGFKAFSLGALKSRAQPICKDRTLPECASALFSAGLYSGSKNSLRRSLKNAGIEYRKIR